MVNAKVIGVVVLLALGIPQSCAEEDGVLELVEDTGNLHNLPPPANNGEQNLGKESVPQLNPTLHLEDVEASDNPSVTFTDQNSAQSLASSSVSSRQNEGSGNTFILPYIRQSGTAADLLHLIQRSRSLPSPSEISGTFYTLNILPPDLDKSYEPEGVQVNPNQSQEPFHQPPPEFSAYSLSQGSETLYESEVQGVKNAENNEHSNDAIQQKERPPLSNVASEVLEHHEEVSQDLPDLDEQNFLANRKRELDISTSSGETSLNDQEFGVLELTQIKTQEDNTPQTIGNSQEPASEAPTIPALHEPVDYIADINLTSDWPKALQISQPVTIFSMNDSVQGPQDSTLVSDTLQNSGDTSPPSIPTQDKLDTEIISNVAEKLVHLREDLQAAHPPETQGKLASFEQPQPQPKPLVATVHKDSQSTIQNLSSLGETPLNSDTTRSIGEKLTGIVSYNDKNESQKSTVSNIYQKELEDTQLVTLDLSHLSSEGHSLFVEVLPLDTELQRAGGISSAAEELHSQISADTESLYNTHSIQLPENRVSSSIQRDQVIHSATEIPVELKSVFPVNIGSQLHSLTESLNVAQPVAPQQRGHQPQSPATKEAPPIPPQQRDHQPHSPATKEAPQIPPQQRDHQPHSPAAKETKEATPIPHQQRDHQPHSPAAKETKEATPIPRQQRDHQPHSPAAKETKEATLNPHQQRDHQPHSPAAKETKEATPIPHQQRDHQPHSPAAKETKEATPIPRQQRDHQPHSPAAKETKEAAPIPRQQRDHQPHSPAAKETKEATPIPRQQRDHQPHSPAAKETKEATLNPHQQRDHQPHSPAAKETKEATPIPPFSEIGHETHAQDHTIDEGQQPSHVPESSQEPNSDLHNDKFHHRDLSIEGSAVSGTYKAEISKISTSREPQEVTAARQPRRSRGGLTPLFTPPETREDFKESLPHSSAEEEKVSTPYQFSYNVKDPSKGADFGHQEGSDGKTVKGQYFVVLPDGRKQTVQYQADHENGYQSEVEYHPQDVPSGGIIRGDAFSLEHIFTRGNNNNLQDLGSNNNVNNQYQQEVLQNNAVLDQGTGTDYQHIPNEEVLHQHHQDGASVDINSPFLQLPEQPFQVSNDQYQVPVDNQFQQPSPGNQQGLINDHSHFDHSDFDDQFHEQDNFDQPLPHSDPSQYQSLNGGPNFQPDFGGGQFPLPNNGDQFHPVEANQFQENNQFLQHGEIRNDGNIQPSDHFIHQPIGDGNQHFADGDNQYELENSGDQPFPIAEGNQHQFQDSGNLDQPSIANQYQETNGNDQFLLQNEGNNFNFLGGSDHLQVNGDFGHLPHSSENNPVQYTHSEPLNAQSGNVPFIAQADDSEFHSLHSDQSQPPTLNEESFGSQSKSDPIESQSIASPLPTGSLDLQTQPFLSPGVIPTTEDHNLNPGYSSNECESSIETSHDQTQIRNELKSIASENFPQRRDVHNQKDTHQVVPSIDDQPNIPFNDSQDGYNDFHDYDGRENAQELLETESSQHFEDGISPNNDFSSESFQVEEVLHENVERNSFQGEGLVTDTPEILEQEKLYSESSDS